VVRTDHNSFRYFLEQKDLNERYKKWVSKVQEPGRYLFPFNCGISGGDMRWWYAVVFAPSLFDPLFGPLFPVLAGSTQSLLRCGRFHPNPVYIQMRG